GAEVRVDRLNDVFPRDGLRGHERRPLLDRRHGVPAGLLDDLPARCEIALAGKNVLRHPGPFVVGVRLGLAAIDAQEKIPSEATVGQAPDAPAYQVQRVPRLNGAIRAVGDLEWLRVQPVDEERMPADAPATPVPDLAVILLEEFIDGVGIP